MGDIRLKIVANSAAEGEVKCRESDFPKFFASAHINVLRARERERVVAAQTDDLGFSVQFGKVREGRRDSPPPT